VQPLALAMILAGLPVVPCRGNGRFSTGRIWTAAGPGRVLTAKVNPGVEARCQPGLPPVGRRGGRVPGSTLTA
jgi:hypothetical protein